MPWARAGAADITNISTAISTAVILLRIGFPTSAVSVTYVAHDEDRPPSFGLLLVG